METYPYFLNDNKPYIVVMSETGPVNMSDIQVQYEHRGMEIVWNSGHKEDQSWLHEINISIDVPEEYGDIIDAYVPLADCIYHKNGSNRGLNVHIDVNEKHFDQAYSRVEEAYSKMYYWCSRCEV